jgi:hypothetical protein
MPRCWYAYVGSGDPQLVANYSFSGVTPGCLNGSTICTIYAPACGSSPTVPLSVNMRRYIAAALATGVSQPQASGNPKQYVYLKTL